MLPKAVFIPFKLVVQALSAFAFSQAFSFCAFVDHDDAQFGVNLPDTILVTARCADLEFGRNDQFFGHMVLGYYRKM